MGSVDKEERRGVSVTRVLGALLLVMSVIIIVLLICLLILPRNPSPVTERYGCPDQMFSGLFQKVPDNVPNLVLGDGKYFILEKSLDVNTIVITDGATLVVSDTGSPIKIRTKYILIRNSASLIIGSESCPYVSDLHISLYGKSDDPDSVLVFGRKFIGVDPSGSIDIHGPWKLSWTFLTFTLQPGMNDVIITLQDDVRTWKTGDVIVIASSSYDMNQAEKFTLMDCPTCQYNQVKIKGTVQFYHCGEILEQGVDMRAEVGILTRNIKISGEMEPLCYLDNHCQYFNYDTFGAHVQVLVSATRARFEGIELYNVGQQWLGKYPIHFHRAGYSYDKYAKQLSIHESFSRCVTIHESQGILVEDVVAYNVMGHCFFLEDGNEIDNTFRHNLGLVTKYSTILPTDRNEAMCKELTANPNLYLPNPPLDCRAVSTFWISHPNNTFEFNSAAGSVEVGYYWAFYREPTGPSQGTLSPFHGERTTVKRFVGNIGHSNFGGAIVLDNGVKGTQPFADDPRDFLALVHDIVYAPHLDRNLSLPRDPAYIQSFTAYKNMIGILARGGDIVVHSARIFDNDIGVWFRSSSTLPYDDGSHQEVFNSTFIGKTRNNSEWSKRIIPSVAVQLQDGPVVLTNNSFYSYVPTPERQAFAMAFLPNNSGVSSPANTVNINYFYNQSVKAYLGPVGNGPEADGDKTQNLFDAAGSLTGVPGAYIIRADNPLLMTSQCKNTTDSPPLTFCPNAKYGLLFVKSSINDVMLRIGDVSTSNTTRSVTLSGHIATVELQESVVGLQFQPVLRSNSSYRLTWLGNAAPRQINISSYLFQKGDFLDVEICYSSNTTFNITRWLWDQTVDKILNVSAMSAADDVTQLYNNTADTLYYWNSTTRLLHIRLITRWGTEKYSYCPDEGCHFITVAATSNYNYTQCD